MWRFVFYLFPLSLHFFLYTCRPTKVKSVTSDWSFLIGSNQHRFMKGKSCLTNLIAFCDKMTGVVNEGRAVDIYLDVREPLDTDTNNIHTDKLMKYGLEIWPVWWTENLLNCQAHLSVRQNPTGNQPMYPGSWCLSQSCLKSTFMTPGIL